MSESTPARPVGVTLVTITVWASGAMNVITGILLLFQTGNAERVAQFGGSGAMFALAIALAILGAVTLIVATGLFRGSNGARIVVTLFQLLSIAAAVYVSVAAPWLFWAAVASIFLSLIVLALLYVGRAGAFFSG